MRDIYLSYENALERLKKDYKTHGTIIVAYDFDNTVYSPTGETSHKDIINLLQRCKKAGIAKFICYTASKPDRYDFIVNYLLKNKIPFDSINKDLIEDREGGKIYYNIFLDDRAGLVETYNLLNSLLSAISKGDM